MTDQLYDEVKRTVSQLAWHYSRRTGMPYDELLSVANEAFVHAYHSYDFANARSFGGWVRLKVNSALMDEVRASMVRAAKGVGPLACDPPGREPRKDPWELLDELPALAARVLEAVLNPPPDVLIELLSIGKWAETKQATFRGAVVRHFLALGWGEEDIRQAFAQVKEAL